MENYLNVQQSDEALDQKMIEITERHPVMMNFAIMKQLEIRAKKGDDVAAMALPILMQGLNQGGGGRPNEPVNFEQGLGTPQTQGGTGNPQRPTQSQTFGGI